ncbi:TetR family transcriptional regulator [Archangium gephyra]|uniref:TetR family transcriptional regulator n=1 Tax=Archangium gephyra TaxID=48 RepID=A0AAC8Q5L4_9BACT|nr:TetR/AcrR family transcriptional regulator [Archangium gephyra]AKJ00758.1 Transcriptional regulator, TetR family [Archangium gephyra]REG25920.1 TetR family transcriptional regulator [Archangium gephyra]
MTEADEARARILEKAEQFFLTHGYSRVTMDDLATELRMSKKTLYRHFSSKEELGEAAITASFARIGEELRAILEDERRDFGERLEAFIRTLAGRYERGAMVLRDLQRDAPALWQKLLELRREAVQKRFGAFLAAGVKLGALRADVEPRLVLRMVLTLVDQLMRPDVLAELGMTAEQVFPRMLGVILDGIRTRA